MPNYKIMPNNLDAEQAVLGCLLIDNECQTELMYQLKVEDFYTEAHQSIFSAMQKVFQRNIPIDFITLTEELEREGKINGIGGIDYISFISNVVPSAANYKYYSDIVKRNIYLIESVDSFKLAKEINKEAIKQDKKVNILIEVNIANDPNKTGIHTTELDNLINEVKELPNINLKGLMAIAPHTEDTNQIRISFKEMKKLKDKYNFELLSMGMSSDYKIAIEEGTDIIRIGTKIFGERDYSKR